MPMITSQDLTVMTRLTLVPVPISSSAAQVLTQFMGMLTMMSSPVAPATMYCMATQAAISCAAMSEMTRWTAALAQIGSKGAGTDTLTGGDGTDTLSGGAGNDTLTGGLLSDTFEWTLGDVGARGTPAVDTITDFNPASQERRRCT
ncbi:MAG: calcium-binding protein [Rhodocyclaceae bacterium]|nr:calcium-binding protein [Rhodocyclaceae bacterium]